MSSHPLNAERHCSAHEFTLVLAGIDALSPEAADALYQCFDDGTAGSTGGIVTIEFHREAESLRESVLTAIADVERAGFQVQRVETEDSLVLSEINAALNPAST